MSSLNWLAPIRDTLEELCLEFDVPLGVAIGWIQTESGGYIDEVTKLDERGFFQLMPEESKDLHLNHERLSIDVDYSLRAGFKLMNYYRLVANRLCSNADVDCIPGGSEYMWRLIKFCHSIGQGATHSIFMDAAEAKVCLTWDSLCAFMSANNDKYLHTLKHSPLKWIGLVNDVFTIGRPYGICTLPPPGPIVD